MFIVVRDDKLCADTATEGVSEAPVMKSTSSSSTSSSSIGVKVKVPVPLSAPSGMTIAKLPTARSRLQRSRDSGPTTANGDMHRHRNARRLFRMGRLHHDVGRARPFADVGRIDGQGDPAIVVEHGDRYARRAGVAIASASSVVLQPPPCRPGNHRPRQR